HHARDRDSAAWPATLLHCRGRGLVQPAGQARLRPAALTTRVVRDSFQNRFAVALACRVLVDLQVVPGSGLSRCWRWSERAGMDSWVAGCGRAIDCSRVPRDECAGIWADDATSSGGCTRVHPGRLRKRSRFELGRQVAAPECGIRYPLTHHLLGE